jgi:hypothetical protein
MKKTLAIATLALSLFAFGCDDDEDGGNKSDAATNKPDASDAASPTSDAKTDTVAPADTAPTADAADGGAGADANADASADAVPADWTMCANPKDGVSTQDFCVQYLKACTFDTAGGGTGTERYKNLSDCVMAYDALSPTKRGCVAYHLCAASMPGNATLHCPHPPEASLMSPTGPCAN